MTIINSKMKKMQPVREQVDYRGVAGMMLRGRNVYGAGGTSPNPTGQNQHSNAAKAYLKRMRGK